ncbi:hypothetical protein [Sphingomonas asaccharolytica]|uniref:hypothetical protein n=1 Tax=Sphingomonas asaccharolytica TaxID=40681 RepID=UPI000830DEA0|nr:hypothetical protein [Sphingomonas asaccharolytica]
MTKRLRAPAGGARVGLDIATQFLSVGTSFIDRLFLTGLALRVLGVAGFEYWSVAMSLSALLSVLDFGCLMNFSNMVVHAKERGDRALSARIYGRANTIFLVIGCAAALGGLTIALSPALQNFLGLNARQFVGQAPIVLGLFAVATGFKLTVSNAMAAYRANLQFARGSTISAFVDLLRILGTIAGLQIGGLVGAAAGHAFGICIGLLLMMVDISRTMPEYRYRLRSPRSEEMRGVFGTSLAFAAPFIPITIMNQGPVLLLNGHAALGSSTVAIFVLLRTLSSVIRTIMLKVTNVLGMEAARLAVRGEEGVARRLLDLMGWQMTAITSYLAGVLLAGGSIFVQFWTGKSGLFDPLVLAMMLAPLVLTPTYLVATSFLQYRNTPRVWTVGMFAQLPAAALVYFGLAGQSELLRISAAAFLGELVGLAIPVTLAIGGGVHITIIREISRTVAAAVLTAVAYMTMRWLIEQLGMSLGGLAVGSMIMLLPYVAIAALPLIPIRALLMERR